MRIHYGYTDASGEYRITIDTERCNGCGECVKVCPESIFEVVEDEFDIENEDKLVVKVKDSLAKAIGHKCLGYKICSQRHTTCQFVCPNDAIRHTW